MLRASGTRLARTEAERRTLNEKLRSDFEFSSIDVLAEVSTNVNIELTGSHSVALGEVFSSLVPSLTNIQNGEIRK